MGPELHKSTTSRLPQHFVATAYVVDGAKVLLVHHRKIGLWLPAGGHIEPDEDPAEAAIREVKEETGLNVRLLGPVDEKGNGDGVRMLPTPHHLQIEQIAEGPHEHIDFVYVGTPISGQLERNPESIDVRWFTGDELDTASHMDANVRHFAHQILEESRAPEGR